MSIQCSFTRHDEARKAGWFSRRHQTDEAHRAAQDDYRNEQHDKAEREHQQRDETAAWKAAR